ncbi:MAG TPA: hypothetical protein VF905_01550, partial [Nitrospirota bacterium]
PPQPRRRHQPTRQQPTRTKKATRAANSEASIAQTRQPENMARKAVKRRVMRNSTGQTVPSGLACLTVPSGRSDRVAK